jgi:hypothetical protein
MQRTILVCPLGSHSEDVVAGSLALAHEDVLASAFMVGFNNSKLECIPYGCRFGYCNVVVLVIILTIEVRYTVVQHFIGLAYIVALRVID